jgi:hypothetical protein
MNIALLEVSPEIIQKERIDRLSIQNENLASNLRLLQAQVEPQFRQTSGHR